MDPLSLLRDFTIKKKKIVLSSDENYLVFDDIRLPRKSLTNYRSDRGRSTLYELDALWFFLQKPELHAAAKFAVYRDECKKWGIQTVRIVDRQDLVQYLTGETDTSAYIVNALDRGDVMTAAPAAPAAAPTPKRPEVSEIEHKAKKARLDSHGNLILDEELTESKRAYCSWLASRATEKVTLETVVSVELPASASAFVASERDVSREIIAKERSAISFDNFLLSNSKSFESIVAIRDAAMTSASSTGQGANNARNTGVNARNTRVNIPARHNRYELAEDITTRASGMGGDVEQFGIAKPGQSFVRGQSNAKTSSNPLNSNPNQTNPKVANSHKTAKPAADKSDGYLIIVPAAPSALINMLNAKEFFEDGKYVSTEEKRAANAKKAAVITFSRKDVNYKIVDSELQITNWDRVAAVITHGPEWQFKNWKYNKPVEIFDKFRGFFFKMHDDVTPPNILQWNVKILPLNRLSRHRDTAIYNEFWAILDHFIATRLTK